LASLKRDDQPVAAQFDLYIGGLEVFNGFSKLLDLEEQRKRFDQ